MQLDGFGRRAEGERGIASQGELSPQPTFLSTGDRPTRARGDVIQVFGDRFGMSGSVGAQVQVGQIKVGQVADVWIGQADEIHGLQVGLEELDRAEIVAAARGEQSAQIQILNGQG